MSINILLRASVWRDGDKYILDAVWEDAEAKSKWSTRLVLAEAQRLALIEKLQSAAT